jgi:exodeoxyribonuclease-3
MTEGSSAPGGIAADAPGATITVATWNVNSLRMRHERLIAWLAAKRPDVVCLQELKMQTADFPTLDLQNAGYYAVVLGQKSYNGVAILSRVEHGQPTDVALGLGDEAADAEARIVSAFIPGLGIRVASVYVPNGQTIDSDKYSYKLTWLGRLRAHLDRRHNASEPLLLCGDFNVAPGDLDVYDPAGWRDTVICHTAARDALSSLLGFGLFDTLRHVEPSAQIYTYWDYRMLSFPKNLGLRIDHILCTAPLLTRCLAARVDREARKGQKPSDHAPLILTLRR